MQNYSIFQAMALHQAFGKLPKGSSKAACQARQAFADALNAMGVTFGIYAVSKREYALRIWDASGQDFPEHQTKVWSRFINGPLGTIVECDGKWYVKLGVTRFEAYDTKDDAQTIAHAKLGYRTAA